MFNNITEGLQARVGYEQNWDERIELISWNN